MMHAQRSALVPVPCITREIVVLVMSDRFTRDVSDLLQIRAVNRFTCASFTVTGMHASFLAVFPTQTWRTDVRSRGENDCMLAADLKSLSGMLMLTIT